MKDQNTYTEERVSLDCGNLFELMLNNINESFVLVDRNLIIVESNNAAREGLWKKAGMKLYPGISVLESVDEQRIPLLKKLFAEVLEGETRKTEYTFIDNDGEVLHFENSMLPARNGAAEIIGIIIFSKDITEKKIAELAIKEAEERWQFAFEASNQAAWDWNMITNEVIYSTSYRKMYGFLEDDLKNDVGEWASRIHPDDRKKIENALIDHSQSGNPVYETTYRIRLKSGNYKWILARGKIISRDATGKPIRMIGTHTDLTEKLKNEEAIRQMNERFEFAAKASSQALWEWDATTGQAYISPSFSEIFGWKADENNFFEQWHQYVHPDDRKDTIDNYYHTLHQTVKPIWQAEYRFLKNDGTYANVSDKAYILRDEQGIVKRVIGATEDITAKKQIEAELKRSNERFNLMMQATNELLWEWNLETRELYRSTQGLKRVYGLEDESLVKTHEQWLERVHPDDRKRIQKSVEDIFAGGHMSRYESEYRFLNGTGTYNYLYGCGILITDETGKPVRLVGTEQNITERKLLEQELLANELAYKKLINQATVDSQEQERTEIGRELHDNINQVLTTTKLYLELAIGNRDMTEELLQKASQNISKAITEIRQLSRSLMDPAIGDLGIVDTIHDLIENINLTKKIAVELEIDPFIENILDKKQKLTVFRIIQEALNNVIKHAKATSVMISIKQQNNTIRLQISDDGVGFDYISTKKGAGLKNITNRVYLINGHLRIDSRCGEGCTILITIPN